MKIDKYPESLGLDAIRKKYIKNRKRPFIFNFKDAAQKLLNGISFDKKRQIHYIHNYPGRIYFHIPLFFLSHPEFDEYSGVVLDPFAGSGTVLAEAILNPVKQRKALGIEINPVGRLISKVKTTKLHFDCIEDNLKELRTLYLACGKQKIVQTDFQNIELWFSQNAIIKLTRLKYAIENSSIDTDLKDFFWLCFSNIVRKVSKADPFVPPPVILKPIKYGKGTERFKNLSKLLKNNERPNVWQLFSDAVCKINPKLFQLNGLNARIVWDEASSLRKGNLSAKGSLNKKNSVKIKENTVDIIITSPPYLTAQKYLRTTKLEAMWLGYDNKEILHLEKKSVGTEYISEKTEIVKIKVKSVDNLIQKVMDESVSRANMVFVYFDKMKQVLKEMYRVLKFDSYAILVVGDNRVLKKKVDTHLLIRDIAVKIGFKEIAILKDRIKNRSMMTKRNGTGGLITNEFVIILKKI